MAEFRIYIGERLCCIVSIGDIKLSSDVGAIKIGVEQAIAFELFKSLFLTSRFRVAGTPTEPETGDIWGHCDWDDLKSIFDEFPSPWRYEEVNPPESQIFVWEDVKFGIPNLRETPPR